MYVCIHTSNHIRSPTHACPPALASPFLHVCTHTFNAGLAHLAPHKPVQIQVKQPKGPAVSASESLLSSSTAQPQLHQLIRALIPHRLAMLHRRGEERARTKEQTQAARLFPPQTEDKEEASESSGRNKHSARELGARAGSVPEDNAGGDLEEEEKRFVLSMSSYGIEGEDEVEDETELETFVLEVMPWSSLVCTLIMTT